MLTGCKTSPAVIDPVKYITVAPVPELVYFEADNPELLKIIKDQSSKYTYILKLLLDLQSTGLATPDIAEDISYTRDVLDWFESLTTVK